MADLTCRYKKDATRVLISVIGLLCLNGWVGAPVDAAEHEELHFDLGLDRKAASTQQDHRQLN